jgi:hypothetical protein
MNSFKPVVTAACFIFGMTICRANLGETEAQCIARYGQEFDVQENLGFDVIGDKAASFNLKTADGPLVAHVIFWNGADVMEKITNADASRDISEEQKQAILNSQSTGLKWSRRSTHYRTDRSDLTSANELWLRSDGATAVCWMFGKLTYQQRWGEIDLSTRQYASAQGELDRQDGAR